MTYTIKEIADLAGVTTRTLRYYDEIGLLHPAETGDNGYRYYDHGSLMLLQQIRFARISTCCGRWKNTGPRSRTG
jgi:DNA-binding transcriptional MerR regulator